MEVPMNTMTSCLKIDQLADYLVDPDSPAAVKTSLHLAQCRACRSRADTLATMKAHLGAISGDTMDQAANEDAALDRLLGSQAIARFVAGQLADDEAPVVRRALADSPLALKAALHFAESSAAMQRELQPDATTAPALDNMVAPREEGARSSVWINLATALDRLRRRWRTLLWTALPSAALAIGILIVAVTIMQRAAPRGVQVASYQDKPILEFRAADQAPGIGFFNPQTRREAAFGAVKVALSTGNRVELTWPEVPQARVYTLRLARIVDGKPVSLGEFTGVNNRAAFTGLDIVLDQRYLWTLSGKTTQNQVFFSEGGFVLHELACRSRLGRHGTSPSSPLGLPHRPPSSRSSPQRCRD